MYYKNYYNNLTEKGIANRIKEEGFDPVKFSDIPGFIYTPHKHPETKLLAFLDGDMDVKVAGEEIHFGPHGCTFFWSEKII